MRCGSHGLILTKMSNFPQKLCPNKHEFDLRWRQLSIFFLDTWGELAIFQRWIFIGLWFTEKVEVLHGQVNRRYSWNLSVNDKKCIKYICWYREMWNYVVNFVALSIVRYEVSFHWLTLWKYSFTSRELAVESS